MKVTRVRIPKALIGGLLLSIVAFWIVGGIITEITLHIPTSALATIQNYLKLNNNNPQVYNTQLYLENVPAASNSDAFVATPISMLVGGLVFGLSMRKTSLLLAQKAKFGAVVGVAQSVGLILLTWILTGMVIRAEGGPGLEIDTSLWTPQALLIAAAQILLSAFTYTIGTVITGRIPTKKSVISQTQKTVAGTKAV